MNIHDLIMLILQASVIVNVFALGLEATKSDALFVLRRPRLLARSILAMFVAMPVLAVLLASLFKLAPEVEIALVCLSISPIPPLLPKKQDKAGGHSSYALGLMVCMALLSLLFIPLAAHLLGSVFSKPFTMDLAAIAILVAKVIVAPLIAGMAVRAWAPSTASRFARPAILVAGWLLPLGGVVILFAMRHAIVALIGHATLVALLGFIAAGLLAGHLLGGPDRDEKIVLAMSTASRHPGVAIGLAAANYPENHHVPALILLYLVLGMFFSLAYMKWQQARNPVEASP